MAFLFSLVLWASLAPADDKEEPQGLLTKPIETEYTLEHLILALYHQKVIAWQGEDQALLETGASLALETILKDGIRARRANEAGLAVEDHVERALKSVGFEVGTPRTRSGRKQSTGYPDLSLQKDGRHYYLEVKVYRPDTVNTTQRTFYLSPSEDPKVTRAAYHLLIAFAMERDEEGMFRPQSVKLLDLSKLQCRLKLEYNASNRDLYNEKAGLIIFKAKPTAEPK